MRIFPSSDLGKHVRRITLLVCLGLFLSDPPAIVAQHLASTRQQAPRLDVAQNQQAALITGKVIDERGNPAPNVVVQAMRVRFSLGQLRLAATGDGALTDEMGEYRLEAVPPGQYYILASGLLRTGTKERNDQPAYAPMFYPGTADIRAAKKILVRSGQTISGVIIGTTPVYLAALSGTVVGATGSIINRGSVTASLRGGILPGKSGPIRPDGTFRIDNVPPGEYLVSASPPGMLRSPGDSTAAPEFATAIVQVNGEDLTGLRLRPSAVIVSGRILLDDPAAAPFVDAAAIRLRAHILNARGSLRTRPKVNDDFTFELKTVPGVIAFDAAVAPSNSDRNGWQVKAIIANGADVTDSGIDVQNDTYDVDIVLTNHKQKVTGIVTDERGAALKDYVVVVFPQDRARWSTALNRHVAVGRPDAKGVFEITTLPPGQYYATAVDHVDGFNEWQDPEFLETLTSRATTLSLSEGNARTVTLTLSRINLIDN